MYPIWELYNGNLDLFRQDLMTMKVHPALGWEEQASILDLILPYMIGRLSEEELRGLLEVIIAHQGS